MSLAMVVAVVGLKRQNSARFTLQCAYASLQVRWVKMKEAYDLPGSCIFNCLLVTSSEANEWSSTFHSSILPAFA